LSTVYINAILVGEEDITMSDGGVIEAGETCTITIINQSIMKDKDIKVKVVCIDGVSTEGVF
jgi:hypothetical protein